MIVIRKGGVAQNESHHPKFYIKVPNAMPSKSCINIIPATDTALILLCAVLRTIIVSIYAKGSLLPLSSSKILQIYQAACSPHLKILCL